MRYTRQITATLMATLLLAYACGKDEPQRQSEPEQPKQEQPAKEEPKPKTEEDKPKDPPAETPPAEGDKPKDPPAETPPAEGDKPKDPPAQTPPAEGDKPKDPPAETPPAEGDKPNNPPKEDKPQQPEQPTQPSAFVEHKYIITEFVGQDCHNCYRPLNAMRMDKERNGQKLALITMHHSERRSPDVYNSEAIGYIDALIGRRAVPNLAFNTLKANPEGVDVMLSRPDAIELQGGLQLSGRKVKLDLKAIQRAGQSERLQGRQLKLLLWAVEEGVAADQINDSRSWVRNYVYQGLFRGSLNGLWGIDLALGDRYDLEYTLPTSLGNLEQSYIYILICDATTHETLDVSSIALIKK